MNRTYRDRPARGWRRRGQQGAWLISALKKVAKHTLTKKLIKTGAEHLPGLYNSATNEIKK